MVARQPWVLLQAVLLLLLLLLECSCSSNAAADDDGGFYKTQSPVTRPVQEEYGAQPRAQLFEDVLFATNPSAAGHLHSECPLDLGLAWTTDVEASIYSTPAIVALKATGRKQLVIPTFFQYVEVLEHDGHKTAGWPLAFEDMSFHTSPLVYDLDDSGQQDIVVCDSNGKVIFIHLDESANYLREFTLAAPRLSVRHDWYEGMDEGNVEAFMTFSDFHEPSSSASKPQQQQQHQNGIFEPSAAQRSGVHHDGFGPRPPLQPQGAGSSGSSPLAQPNTGRRLLATDEFGLPIGDEREGEGPASQSGADDGQSAAAPTPQLLDNGHVLLDAHILATPAIGDVDGDGTDDMVIGVSYYFNLDDYEEEEYQVAPDVVIKPSKYAASGVVCYDLVKQRWKYQVHLDLSTADAEVPSRVYAQPTITDLDADGSKDVVVATTLGFVYVLDSTGAVRPGFPVQLGEVEGQVAVEDVAGDAALELIIADSDGSVTVLSHTGDIVWQRTFVAGGASPAPPVLGDVNGDGRLDVVITGRDGGIWALEAATGKDLPHFPVRTGGRIMAPTTLLRLVLDGDRAAWAAAEAQRRTSAAAAAAATVDPSAASALRSADGMATASGGGHNAGLQIIVPCFDGHVYVVAGATGCTNKIDIGEHSYAAVLADDLSEDGLLELVVSTMNGNVMAFSTSTPAEPLNTQPTLPLAGNGLTYRSHRQGAMFVQDSHHHRFISGAQVLVQFEIVDYRPRKSGLRPQYTVSISMGRQVYYTAVMREAGQHSVSVSLPHPQRATLELQVENEHGQTFTDVTTLSFNTRFYAILKWLVALPLALSAGLILILPQVKLAGSNAISEARPKHRNN